ncbi:MAG: O-antigen ligase family protein [Bryobacteraceae bacterium]|nr:O-antigen ligase family protein [Bryobacteraceae bacterium]
MVGPVEERMSRLALYLGSLCAVSAVVSIAAAQLLLALALAALLLSDRRLRMPPVWVPLAVFVAATVVALLASGDPASGRPQIRKFFVLLMLPVLYSGMRALHHARALVLALAAAASASAAVALGQFALKWEEARRQGTGFYDAYIAERITGFMSHWMTFGGQMMLAGLLVVAFLLFSPSARGRLRGLLLVAATLIAAAILLNMTRSIWLASFAALAYLAWHWRRTVLLVAPGLLGLFLLVAPASLRTRFVSIYRPRAEVDSNLHRIVCWRTGLRMVQAHPWLGLGPEQVRLRFHDYLPADAPQPLPPGWYGHLHNLYLHYAAERGIPAAMALVWFLAQAFWELARAARRAPQGHEARFLLHGAAACVLGIAVSGFFEVNLGDSEVLMLFLAVLALGYTARERLAEESGYARVVA